MSRLPILLLFMCLLALSAGVPGACAQSASAAPPAPAANPAAGAKATPAEAKPAPARVTFIKQFPGSHPDYYAVSVTEDGEASYLTAPDDPQPLRFRLSEAVARNIFDTVARLNHLRGVKLESPRRVAAMGKKTLAYEANGQRNEVSFNYSENPDAVSLAGVFEKIGTTEQHAIALERAMRYDRLGVMKMLLQIEVSMNKREMVEPSQLVPMLEEISGDSRYMHIAQQRARLLLARIRSEK